MVDPASLIDEEAFLAMDDAGAVAALEGGRTEGTGRRAQAMALLLTELDDPDSVADAIKRDINIESDVLRYLLALVDAHTEPGAWPGTRAAIPQRLAGLEAERQRCEDRLAARLADKAAGRTSIQPSPEEEPDIMARRWAAKLREEWEMVDFTNDLNRLRSEHLERMIGIRRAYQGRRSTQRWY